MILTADRARVYTAAVAVATEREMADDRAAAWPAPAVGTRSLQQLLGEHCCVAIATERNMEDARADAEPWPALPQVLTSQTTAEDNIIIPVIKDNASRALG